jgi:hypothetical protein
VWTFGLECPPQNVVEEVGYIRPPACSGCADHFRRENAGREDGAGVADSTESTRDLIGQVRELASLHSVLEPLLPLLVQNDTAFPSIPTCSLSYQTLIELHTNGVDFLVADTLDIFLLLVFVLFVVLHLVILVVDICGLQQASTGTQALRMRP